MLTRLAVLSNPRRAWLLRRATNLCGNRADAEDLVQETFARFMATFRDDSELPGEDRCVAWLVSTMVHHFYDQLRRRNVRERNAAELMVEPDVAPSPDSHERSPGEEITDEQLKGAIQALSPPLRTTLSMQLEGRKHREIGEECGISPGAVGKRLFDARVKLRSMLGSRAPVLNSPGCRARKRVHARSRAD